MYWSTRLLIVVYLMGPTVAFQLPDKCGSIDINYLVNVSSGVSVLAPFFTSDNSELSQRFPAIKDSIDKLVNLGKELSPVVGAIIYFGAAIFVSYCYTVDSRKKSDEAKILEKELRLIMVEEVFPTLETILKVINDSKLEDGQDGFEAPCHKKDGTGVTVLGKFTQKIEKIENRIEKSTLSLRSEVIDLEEQTRIFQWGSTGVTAAIVGTLVYAAFVAKLGPVGIAMFIVCFGGAIVSYEFKTSSDTYTETLDLFAKILENAHNAKALITRLRTDIENGCLLKFK